MYKGTRLLSVDTYSRQDGRCDDQPKCEAVVTRIELLASQSKHHGRQHSAADSAKAEDVAMAIKAGGLERGNECQGAPGVNRTFAKSSLRFSLASTTPMLPVMVSG
jgi:hypothetical protein